MCVGVIGILVGLKVAVDNTGVSGGSVVLIVSSASAFTGEGVDDGKG